MEKCRHIIYCASIGILIHVSTLFAVDFSGAVQLNGCSGSLIRFNFSKDSDRALVLSAGHCSVLPVNTGEFAYHYRTRDQVVFLNADGSLNSQIARTSELVYASVTDTDISIYALRETYAQIKARIGFDAFTVSSISPKSGDDITIISGRLQKSYSCHVANIAYLLIEGDYIWKNSIRYSDRGCDVVGGTSGSPLLNKQREVVGINNTGTGHGKACTDSVPCEVSASGAVMYSKEGTNYGQQTHLITTCFNHRREFDITVPDCQLFH